MRFPLFSGLSALSIVVGLGVSPAIAENLTVEVTGQAAESGLGRATTRLRALEAALIEAAIEGGADINGYAAASNGILVSDRLILRPASRILDYSIVSEGVENGFYRVRVRAIVGDPPVPVTDHCARRAQLDIISYPLRLGVDPMTPAWVDGLGPQLHDSIDAAIASRPGVSLSRSGAGGAMPGRSAQVGLDMDYAALTLGTARPSTPTPDGGLGYHADLQLQMQGRNRLLLVLESRLVDTGSSITRAQSRLEHAIRLDAGLPIPALNRLASPDRSEIVQKLLTGIDEHITAMIDGYACRPLEGALQLSGGRLTLPFGAKDGLTRHHLAFSEGQDTPYIIFEIENLADHAAVLRPIDQNRNARSLAGMRVRFMELAK
ncbi:flagellar assembly protein T N-terminal domain-containing protein [Roseicyclus sp.]|uniref:flagellar assembly protein T N-terminal domain-containing protein n=1 Tax=Roseicyclus sp. TaxID=1914329 RepID=UPI003F6D68C4